MPPKEARRASAAAAVRTESAFSSSGLPRPATATRFAPPAPAWTMVAESRFPLISPESTRSTQLPVELAVERGGGAREGGGLGNGHGEDVSLDLPRRRNKDVDLSHRGAMLSD